MRPLARQADVWPRLSPPWLPEATRTLQTLQLSCGSMLLMQQMAQDHLSHQLADTKTPTIIAAATSGIPTLCPV
jgi:hypothetical protein